MNNVNYIGMTEGVFKMRYMNHIQSLKDENKNANNTLPVRMVCRIKPLSENKVGNSQKLSRLHIPCLGMQFMYQLEYVDTETHNAHFINKRSDFGNKY